MPNGKTKNSTSHILTKIKWMQKCANVNFSNWSVTPKTWIVLGIIAIFSIWNLSGVVQYSVAMGIRCSPWMYPHYFSIPIMWLVYGFLTAALFSDAPFHSAFSDFLQIRTGNYIWLLGQCLFIAEASLCYSLTYFLLSIAAVLPRVIFISGWGKLIETLAYDTEASLHLVGVCFLPDVLQKYSPIEATLLTVLMVWLVSCFLGMLILACRILFGRHAGIAAVGFLTFLSYFCTYIGSMVFGQKIYRFSPVNWISISIFQETGALPDVGYSVRFLLLGIILCVAASVPIYGKKNEI